MEIKKTPEANIENKRLTFLLMGLVLVLALFYVAFEWTEGKFKAYDLGDMQVEVFEEEMVQQTVQEDTPPPPPPPAPEVIEEIQIVENTVETKSFDIQTEDDSKKAQEVIAAPVAAPEEDPDDKVIFTFVEQMPEFPGGVQEMQKYLAQNIKYPIIDQENGVQGRVVCQFTVGKDGVISDIEVVRKSPSASLDREAVRVIQSMPKWKAGRQRGKAVACKFTLPVVFRLQ